ncbi:MAG TPA: DUF928 domain-containing protein [Coleofasciculaceae cyanobacterium]
MTTRSHLATVVVGTISMISLQLFGIFTPTQAKSLKLSKNLGILTAVVANLPANAASNSTNTASVDQTRGVGSRERGIGEQRRQLLPQTNFMISQATGSRMRFVPPVAKNPRRSQGAGSRGCEQSLPGDVVTLLIPSKDYVGQTTSSHPTFFWHLSQPVSVPIKFTLVEPGVNEPLFEKQIDSSPAGIMQLELPKDRPELATGRTYGWSVTLVCNARRPSANPYFYSWIERVPKTSVLEQQLAAASSKVNSPTQTHPSGNTSSDRNRALIYAQAGLWYDALLTLSKEQINNPHELVQTDFLALLDQVGLTEVVKQEQQRLARN